MQKLLLDEVIFFRFKRIEKISVYYIGEEIKLLKTILKFWFL